MINALEFEEGGRTYTCRVEEVKRLGLGSWWWVSVSGDGHRYAPFRASADDTKASVAKRVVEYYEDHMTRRTTPTPPRSGWGRKPDAKGPAKG